MPQEWLRKGPRTRERLAAETVLNLLPADSSEVNWTNLREKAENLGISSATLRAHLRSFTYLKMVTRRVDPSTYPPHVYYSRRDPLLFPGKFVEVYRLSRELALVGEIVDKAKAKRKTFEIYDAALKTHTLFAEAALPSLLYASLGGKGPYKIIGTGKKGKEEVEKFIAQLGVDTHDLADELLDTVIRPWIHEMLNVFSIIHSGSKHVLEEETESILRNAVRSLKEYDRLLEPFRPKISGV
jgi:DNA-binding transcriptional ArsR family regulator